MGRIEVVLAALRTIALVAFTAIAGGCVNLIDTEQFELGVVSTARLDQERERVNAIASSWDQFDLDGDGALGRDEWRDREWNYYLIFDEDQNQRLSLTEYVRSVCGRSDRLPELFRLCRPKEIRAFLLYTTNADGTAQMSRDQISSRSDGWFRINDLDRDGRVTRAELFRQNYRD